MLQFPQGSPSRQHLFPFRPVRRLTAALPSTPETGTATVVTDATFEAEVLKSDIPVLVDFWAPWCGPCRMIAPLIDQLAEEYEGKLKAVRADVAHAFSSGSPRHPSLRSAHVIFACARMHHAGPRAGARHRARLAGAGAPAPLWKFAKKNLPAVTRGGAYPGLATRLFFLVFSWTRLTFRSHPVLLPPTRQVKLNTDESPSVATEYGIRSIPTVMIFKGGQKLDTVIGAVPKSTLTGTIEKYL